MGVKGDDVWLDLKATKIYYKGDRWYYEGETASGGQIRKGGEGGEEGRRDMMKEMEEQHEGGRKEDRKMCEVLERRRMEKRWKERVRKILGKQMEKRKRKKREE